MFSKSAQYYDQIYASVDKNYSAETAKVRRLIKQYNRSGGRRLLDVGCGTGVHAGLLSRHYQVEGLDLDRRMLAVARKKYPDLRFHHGDMADFKLNRQYDILVCLFSSIGYVRTKARLQKAIRSMQRHLLPGGVLLVEPWFTPRQWGNNRVFMTQINKPDLKIVRMSRSSRQGRVSVLEFQYLFGTPNDIEHQVEHHELGLFTSQEYLNAFRGAGLKVLHDAKGLDGRGLYIGIKL
jgi:ubiquinone/menaquinone biosynthesis C-methylase UbiE